MRKRSVVALGGLALLVSVLAPAGVSPAATRHSVVLNGVLDTVSSTGSVGVAGTKETDAGIFSGTISGKPTKGAVYQTATWGAGLTLTATGTAFDASGSIRGRASAKFTTHPGGALTYTSTLTVTGGTGRYKNAHGTLRLSGAVLLSDSDAASLHLVGSIEY